jgi:hypothetical protein
MSIFRKTSKPVLGPTQLFIKWIPWLFSPEGGGGGQFGLDVNVTSHVHFVPMSRKSGAVLPLVYIHIIPFSTKLFNLFVTLHVSIGIDHQALSTSHEKQDKILYL